ncbi:uncharacterized protein VSU04_016289 [Chlamydotis macqueenii]
MLQHTHRTTALRASQASCLLRCLLRHGATIFEIINRTEEHHVRKMILGGLTLDVLEEYLSDTAKLWRNSRKKQQRTECDVLSWVTCRCRSMVDQTAAFQVLCIDPP